MTVAPTCMIKTKPMVLFDNFFIVIAILSWSRLPFYCVESSSGKEAAYASSSVIAVYDRELRVQVAGKIRLEYICSDHRIGRAGEGVP